MTLHIGGCEWVRVVGGLAQRCGWRGPQGVRCISYVGHGPIKSPSGPHIPSRSLRSVRPTATADLHGFIGS
jgi:hypothetical protein